MEDSLKDQQAPERSDRPAARQKQTSGRTDKFTMPDRPIALAATIGTIAGKLPLLIFLATFVFIVGILHWGQAVLIPVAFSLLLTFLLSPLVDGLERLRLGRIPSVIVIVALAFLLLAAIGWIVTVQLAILAGELPRHQQNIRQKVVDLRNLGKGGSIEQVQKTVDEIKVEMEKGDELAKAQGRPPDVVVKSEERATFWPIPIATAPLLERLASAALAIILVICMLIERDNLRDRLIRLIGYGRMTVTTTALGDAGSRISRYLLMHSILNASYGFAVAVTLFLIGLPYAALWGLLAAVLRFIPYIGPWVAAILPTALALAAFEGWLWPMVVAGLFIVLELIANLILEPLLYGESAGVSQVALLVSVAFWTWLWGPTGLVMATPLTVCLVVLGKYVPQMDYITVLMSDEPVLEKRLIYYQRLLAMDRDEAAQIVEEYVKDNSRDRAYDEVMMPALYYLRLDRERDGLTEVQEQFILEQTRTIVASHSEPPASMPLTDERGGAAEAAPARPSMSILGCPARDKVDEVALLLLKQVLGPTRYEIEIVGDEKLASEMVAEVGEKQTNLVFIAAVQPGGLAQTRYLCKKLRAQHANLKIAVGIFGFKGDWEPARDLLLSAGADQVGTSLVQSREQISNLALVSDAAAAPHL